jgi:chromosome partitioning protein
MFVSGKGVFLTSIWPNGRMAKWGRFSIKLIWPKRRMGIAIKALGMRFSQRVVWPNGFSFSQTTLWLNEEGDGMGEEHHANRQTVVITVGNQKGGVGKTTNTIQLAAALAERGRLSLIIDLDMTSGATKALRAPTDGWMSSFELLTGAENAEDTIITNEEEEVPLPPNVHLIPSSRKLAELDNFLGQNPWVIHQDLLVDPINRLRGRYDYVFLDTPPQKTKTTIPALKAADYAILTAMPDHLAVSALAEALQDIATAQKHANPKLMLLGVVVCAMPRPKTRLARELAGYVERTCVDPQGRTLKFKVDITRSVVLQEAQRMGKSIFQYQGDHPVADQYRALAKELEERLVGLKSFEPNMIAEAVNA